MIATDAFATAVHITDDILSDWMPLFSRSQEPLCGFEIILPHAFPSLVQSAQVELRGHKTMLRRLTIKSHGLHRISVHPISVLIHVSQSAICANDSSACSLAEPFQCLRIIPCRAFACVVHHSQIILCGRLPLLCCDMEKLKGFGRISRDASTTLICHP